MPTIAANGINIHYEERGQGEPLLLLMGLGADGSLWEDHAKAYERHFRCILMDNRGAGATDKPEGPYTTAMMADDAAGLLRALGLKQARVAGISMGSAIAQELALRHPELVRSMVLISSWARCDRYAQDVFDHFRQVREKIPLPAFVRLLQLWIFSAPYYAEHQADLLEGRAKADDNPMPQHAFAAQCAACMAHDALDRLGAIAQPCLLTVGDADIFTPLRFSQEMHQRLSDSELLIFPGLAHVHHWEDLGRFNQATTQFLLNH